MVRDYLGVGVPENFWRKMVTFSTGERDEWQETLFGLEGKIPGSLQAAWWLVSEVAAVLGNLGRSRKRRRGCGRRSRGERLRWG